MNETLIGIYKITNIYNNKVYIGQSKDIYRRFEEHKRKYLYSDKSYLYKDMYTFGIKNFKFEIIELCDKFELDEKEKYYISIYNSCNPAYGYNIYPEAHYCFSNEINHNSKLTSQDVYEIREDYKNHIKKHESYNRFKYKISKNTFHDIWTGKTWNNIHMNVYIEENKMFQKTNYDLSHHARKVTDKQVLFIRDKYNEGILSELETFNLSGISNFNTFHDIWIGHTFKNISSNIPFNRHKNIKIKGYENGCKNPASKLSQEMIDDIRTMYKAGNSIPFIHNKYIFVSYNTIYRVVKYQSYK